jgi:hypothetical protein
MKEVGRKAGLSPHQLKQAERVASVPDADFERQVESDKPPTVTQLADIPAGVISDRETAPRSAPTLSEGLARANDGGMPWVTELCHTRRR